VGGEIWKLPGSVYKGRSALEGKGHGGVAMRCRKPASISLFAFAGVFLTGLFAAQADGPLDGYSVDLGMVTRIRDQGLHHSQVMKTAEQLTAVIGPRLSGSPAMKRAAEWARDTLAGWGLENAALETFPGVGRGWTFRHCSVHMVEPHQVPLIALPKAWTPGTKKKRTGEVVRVKLESQEDLEAQEGKLAGKILFLDDARKIEPPEESPFQRYDHEDLEEKERFDIRTGGGQDWRARYKKRIEFWKKLLPWLEKEKVLATVTPSGWDTGILRVSRGGSNKAGDPQGVPQLMIAAEQYNRILRLLDLEIPVRLEIDVKAEFLDKDIHGYNTVAEIPGTDPGCGDRDAGRPPGLLARRDRSHR